jgi:hypothetical protein
VQTASYKSEDERKFHTANCQPPVLLSENKKNKKEVINPKNKKQ